MVKFIIITQMRSIFIVGLNGLNHFATQNGRSRDPLFADPCAIELHKLITNSIRQKGLDIKNCRGKGYNGGAVMSGKYLQKKIQRCGSTCLLHALCFAQFKFGVKRCHGSRD